MRILGMFSEMDPEEAVFTSDLFSFGSYDWIPKQVAKAMEKAIRICANS